MAEEAKKVEKVRRPQAIKRDIQNEKRRLHNRAYRSKTSTAVRTIEASFSSNAATKEQLNTLFSLLDKGVKTGIFKQNKADRLKSRFTKRLTAKS